MALFLLIRHGHNDAVGKAITGRAAGIRLNARGREEADRVAERLLSIPLTAIFSSPLERTRETAAPLARRTGQEVQISEKIHEIDFGEWTGLTFEELSREPRWRQFNTFRSGTRIPGGEIMVEVQQRMVSEIERLRARQPDGTFALFSHGDPIKTAVAHYAGFPLDHMLRFEISLASISMIDIRDWGARVLCINSLERIDDLVGL